MQRLNVIDYYDLGKETTSLENRLSAITSPVELSAISYPLFVFKWRLNSLLDEPCELLPASQRAVRALVAEISGLIPNEIEALFDSEQGKALIQPYRLSAISTGMSSFETILKNDIPEMATFAVAQIGILRTDDLINNSHHQIDEALRAYLPGKATNDIIEAGKCLAFRLSTASAFHACRAIEACMDAYFEVLTGKPYEVSSTLR